LCVQKAFHNHIQKSFPFLLKSKIVLAVSGGIDSVVLAHLCKFLKLDISLAHCNFNLRGVESDADEAFILKLSKHLGVELYVQKFDTKAYANSHKRSIQMAARELRYNWFQELVQQHHFDAVLTAHHADDNLETFLINFTRGTGLNGLTGIPTINNNIVRPLLPFSRQTIENYAKKNTIEWREDSSNSSRKYLRNKLRKDVIPILKDINPQLLDSFQNTIDNLNDVADIVKESVKAVSKRAIIDHSNGSTSYLISELKKVNNSKAYCFELFKIYGFTEWNDVVNLLDAESGKYVTSSTHKLMKYREFLILTDLKISKHDNTSITIEKNDTSIVTPLGTLLFETVKTISKASEKTIYVNKNKLVYPLKLRLWKSDDIFQPSGMKGKKKVSKYLKDEKISPIKREHTWVLTSEDMVVWVVGYRTDDRFSTNDSDQEVLKITLNE